MGGRRGEVEQSQNRCVIALCCRLPCSQLCGSHGSSHSPLLLDQGGADAAATGEHVNGYHTDNSSSLFLSTLPSWCCCACGLVSAAVAWDLPWPAGGR